MTRYESCNIHEIQQQFSQFNVVDMNEKKNNVKRSNRLSTVDTSL